MADETKGPATAEAPTATEGHSQRPPSRGPRPGGGPGGPREGGRKYFRRKKVCKFCVEKMGKRRLAYTVRRFHDGVYVLLTVEGSGGLIHELERRLRVTEPVLKFISVRIDEEQKRLAKIKAIRDARKKTSAAPAPAAPEGGEAAPAAV